MKLHILIAVLTLVAKPCWGSEGRSNIIYNHFLTLQGCRRAIVIKLFTNQLLLLFRFTMQTKIWRVLAITWQWWLLQHAFTKWAYVACRMWCRRGWLRWRLWMCWYPGMWHRQLPLGWRRWLLYATRYACTYNNWFSSLTYVFMCPSACTVARSFHCAFRVPWILYITQGKTTTTCAVSYLAFWAATRLTPIFTGWSSRIQIFCIKLNILNSAKWLTKRTHFFLRLRALAWFSKGRLQS